jgi:putative ABC transport system permease protein
MNTFTDDLRRAFRMLRKNPGFSALAILALALGMGANTTIFSTLKPMVLQPVPFPGLDQILRIQESLPKDNQTDISVAPPNYRDLVEQNHVFGQMAALRGRSRDVSLTGSGAPVRLEGYESTASYFPLSGMPPLLGRTYSQQEAESQARVAVLSYAAWQRQFAGDQAIIGRSVVLDGARTEIIGVMPPGFDFPVGTDLWTPLAMTTPEMSIRGDHTLYVIARLKPGVSQGQAEAELSTIASNLERQYPATNTGRSFAVELFRKEIAGPTRYFVSILMWAAVFVLLLACANVANLQLARAFSRQKEFAVLAALGASRWRIARRVLVESTVLAVVGGAAGLLIAQWGLAVTKAAVPPFIVQHIAGIKNIKLDPVVLAFTGVVAVLTGIIAGVFPALQASSNFDLHDALKSGMRGSSGVPARKRLRSILVISEVALALVLLVGAGLMVKGFNHLLTEYPGYDAYGVLSAKVTLPENKYRDDHSRAAFYDHALGRLAAIPGVESVSAVRFVPNGWSWQTGTFAIENRPAQAGEIRYAAMQAVSPEYFRQLRIPMRQGRPLTVQDGTDAPFVVVLGEKVARRWWPAGDAIGHRVRFRSKEPWRMVVGVVADIQQSAMSQGYWSTAYVPVAQAPPQALTFLLRTTRDPMLLASGVLDAMRDVDPDQPVYDIRTLRQLATDNASGIEFSAHMMMAFGVIALLLAGAGIYAVMAYGVSQRVHEIGIRVALGAQYAQVLRMIVGNALKLAAVGLAVGLPVAFALSRTMAGLLVGVIRLDVLTFAAFTLVLALVALAAGYLPARRAARVDPMVALRCD